MPQKAYLWILRVGIGLSFLSVFWVYTEFLFPYITSKQIYFNVLVEILVVFWLAFIIKYPEWNPFRGQKKNFLLRFLSKINIFAYLRRKKHPVEEKSSEITHKYIGSAITWGLIAYFFVILITCFTGVDFNLSFWGDIERMLGFFHIVHFLFLYFIIITVMRDWEDWRWLLLLFTVINTGVALSGILGDKAYGTVGNKAYMAGFMIFGVFLSIFLLLKDKSPLRWIQPLFIIIMLVAFKGANVAGAYAGLGAGVITFLFFYGLMVKNRKIKVVSLLAFVLITGGSLFAVTNKDAPVVRNIKPIQDFSLKEATLQTRFIAWRAAWKDFKNHPLLGSGYGNFAITFDKYFDADFYNYTRSGTYFDRAHNNLIDIVSTTGILGFLAYLSIFVAVLYYFWRIYKKKRIKSAELAVLLSLLAAYFVQNLAVFDSLSTYIGLMVFLGFVHFLFNTEEDRDNKRELVQKDKKFINQEIYALGGAGLVIIFIIFKFNFLPVQMLYGTIQGQKAFARNMPLKALASYEKVLQNEGILDRDSRDSFIRSAMSRTGALSQLSAQERNRVLEKAIEWARANVAYNPEDSLAQLRLAQILNISARFNYQNDKEKFEHYSREALEAINRSIQSSPERVPLYGTKANILLTRQKTGEAIKVLKKAIELNPNYEDIYCKLAEIYSISGKQDKGFESMDECLNKKGASALKFESVVKKAINHYLEKGENDKVLDLYKRLSRLEKNNPQVWIKLAQLYARMGKTDEAKQAAQKAAELKPELQSDVEGFIKSLDQTKERTIDISPGATPSSPVEVEKQEK